MVGFVVVSHSKELAEAAIHLANEMKRYDFPLINGSGTDGDFLGSNPLTIKEAILKAKTDKGVLIFVDIGSSVLNTQVAIDFLKDEGVNIENIKKLKTILCSVKFITYSPNCDNHLSHSRRNLINFLSYSFYFMPRAL